MSFILHLSTFSDTKIMQPVIHQTLTLYRQSSPADSIKPFTGFQSTDKITPS